MIVSDRNFRKSKILSMNKIGIFYGPKKGSVSKIAQIMHNELGESRADLHAIKDCPVQTLNNYDKLIFGISTLGRTTWDSEHDDDDWDVFFPNLDKVNWTGKKVAIYGLGDQINYSDHFVDAIGWLFEKLITLKVEVVGFVSPDEFDFNDSEAFIDGNFVGLPLDEDNEPEKSEQRVKNWLVELEKEGF